MNGEEKPVRRTRAQVRANVQRLIDAGRDDAFIRAYVASEQARGILPDAPTTPDQGITPGHSRFTPAELAARADRAVTAEDPATMALDEQEIAHRAAGLSALTPTILQGPQAAIRALARGQTYRDALGDIRGAQEDLPTGARFLPGVAGEALAAMAVPFVRANPFRGSAAMGVAEGLTEADPDVGPGMRGALAGAKGLGYGLMGTVSDIAPGIARAAKATPADEAVLQMLTDRASSAKTMYERALAAGRNREVTPAIRDFLAEPDIAPIVADIRGTREFAALAPDSPEMLDQVYKTLSDQLGRLRKGAELLRPSRPNAGRLAQGDVKAAQEQLLSALETPKDVVAMRTRSTAPAFMPEYRAAVDDYATRSRELQAYLSGRRALKTAGKGGVMTDRELVKESPAQFLDGVEAMSPAERANALAAMDALIREAGLRSPMTAGRMAFVAPRMTRPLTGGTSEAFLRSLLLGAAP